MFSNFPKFPACPNVTCYKPPVTKSFKVVVRCNVLQINEAQTATLYIVHMGKITHKQCAVC